MKPGELDRTVFDGADLIEVPHDYYALGDEIARGGMGRISTARDLRSGRIVAIKEVLSEVLTVYPEAEREEVLARFCREAILTARLEHPSIVPVYEIGRFAETPFFAMKRVTGDPLEAHIDAAESFEERLALLPKIAAVADAIAYAHDRGVIHRDLKPTNVLVGEFGETLVIDWGLAKDIGADEDGVRRAAIAGDVADSIDETLEGSVIGTPQYMPPEQARGEAADRRADVYALGALLYHLLAGQPPFPVRDKAALNPVADVLRRVRDEAPIPLAELAPETPRDLLSIVTKAMARDRDDRYADAGELVADLGSFQRGQLVAVHDYSAGELVRRWLRRHRAAVITAAVLATALIAFAVVFVVENRAARKSAERERNAAQQAIDRWVSMFEQRGRAELHSGDVATAALVLSEAYQHLADDRGVRVAVGDALKAVDPLERVFRVSDGDVRLIVGIGERVAVFADGRLKIYDTNGALLVERPLEAPPRVSVLPDERIVLGYPERIAILDRGGDLLRVITPTEPIATISADPRVIGVGATSGRVEIYDVDTGERIGETALRPPGDFPVPSPITAIAFHPRTTEVLIVTPVRFGLWEDHQLERKRWTRVPAALYVGASLSAKHPRMALGTTLGWAMLGDTRDASVLARLDGHTVVTKASFDATGERIITLGGDTTRVWNGETGALITALPGWTGESRFARFDAEGARAALAGLNGTVRIIDFATGRERLRLVGHARPIDDLQFIGDRLATMTSDGVVKIWNAAADLRTARVATNAAVTLLPNGRRFVTYSASDPVRLWDARERRAIATLPGAWTETAGLSPDGRIVATASGLFDAATGRALERFDLGKPPKVAVANDGRIAILASYKEAVLLDRRGAVIRRLEPPGGRLVDLVWTPSGRLVVPAFGSVAIYDPDADSYRTIDHDKHARPAAVSAALTGDGRRLAISSDDGTTLWDIETGQLLAESELGSAAFSIHPDRDLLAISRASEVSLWKPGRDTETLVTSQRRLLGRAKFSQSGRTLVTHDDLIRVWEVETRTVIIERDIPEAAAAFVLDGDHTLVVSGQTGVEFWDISPEARSPAEVKAIVADKVPRDFENRRGVISRPVPAAR